MSTTPHDNHQPDADSSRDETSNDPAQIEADIARHRAELGDTVDELTERLDVKKQAQHKIESVKAQLGQGAQDAKTRANAGLREANARLHSDDHRDVLSVLAPALGAVAAVVLIIGVARRVRR
ncbi:MAG TPA: hypothetical protein DCM55_07030 [Corynebacterium variabile]|uniref:DUF3618 domain-containing protein n=1 Tax=Corynebacterium variabile TaxID=1727 RepID=UPI000ECC13BA|nr:DUF3618 domain-containing protein [Corynebacterium variabile]HAJ52206.1 hypothetical protein [Corynebacterium variabile]